MHTTSSTRSSSNNTRVIILARVVILVIICELEHVVCILSYGREYELYVACGNERYLV